MQIKTKEDRRDLADGLAVDAGDGDVRLLVDRDVDPGRDVEHHHVRVAQREHHLLALDLRAVADADDVEVLAEALGDTDDHVVDERPRQPVERAVLALVVGALDHEPAVLLAEGDGLGDGALEGALGTLDRDAVAVDLDLDAARHRDRGASYT
jgi:hypothetical protein